MSVSGNWSKMKDKLLKALITYYVCVYVCVVLSEAPRLYRQAEDKQQCLFSR